MEQTTYHSVADLPLVMCVEDLMPILSIGRNTAYELVRSGQIESFRIGRQLRITKGAITNYLSRFGLTEDGQSDIIYYPLHGEMTGAARKE